MTPLIVVGLIAATNVLKYFEGNLQRIFMTILEVWALASAPALASVLSLSLGCLRINGRSVFRTYITESLIRTARTSVSNLRTTLLPLELWDSLKFFLSHPSFGTGSVSTGKNTSGNEMQTTLSRSSGTNSKRFSTIAWVNHKLLWIPTGERSRRTASTS